MKYVKIVSIKRKTQEYTYPYPKDTDYAKLNPYEKELIKVISEFVMSGEMRKIKQTLRNLKKLKFKNSMKESGALYRGIGFKKDSNKLNNIIKGKSKLKTRKYTSWTTDKKIARLIAEEYSRIYDNMIGLVFEKKIPKDKQLVSIYKIYKKYKKFFDRGSIGKYREVKDYLRTEKEVLTKEPIILSNKNIIK